MERKIPPPHPGEVLREEFLKPMELSQSELARKIRINPRRINEIQRDLGRIAPQLQEEMP